MQFLNVLLYIVLAIVSLFLICLVLIQRGKGGGLAGAFGGAGGSSAFGTKAGDIFTRVTMISAGVWIALNMLLVVMSNRRISAYASPDAPAAKTTFTPSKGGDAKTLDPGESLNVGPGAPLPKVNRPAVPPVEVSGGSPSAPVPPSPAPIPKP